MSSSVQHLRHLISAMRWDDALARLSSHPDEARTVSAPLGETALSAACRMKAPPSLIAALLNSHPDAATLRLVGSGRTPLHLACSDLRRTAGGRGFEDDAEVVRLILTARPECAAVADDDGWLPLHCACSSGPGLSSDAAPLAMIRDLLCAYPDSALVPNRGGVTPLSMLWDRSSLNEEDGRCILCAEAARYHDRIDEVERRRAALAAENPDYSRRGFRPRQNSASVWSRVLLMARAAYHGTVGDVSDGRGGGGADASKFRPLHALAGIECPPSVVEFAVRVHGDEGALRAADGDGNLPLHVAAARAGPGPCVGDRGVDGAIEESSSRGDVLKILLRAYPRAARVQNRASRVPLNLAVEAGAQWDAGGVRELFEAAPEALGARDVATGLHSFMLAASVDSLDVSYNLLRRSPGLVASGCTSD